MKRLLFTSLVIILTIEPATDTSTQLEGIAAAQKKSYEDFVTGLMTTVTQWQQQDLPQFSQEDRNNLSTSIDQLTSLIDKTRKNLEIAINNAMKIAKDPTSFTETVKKIVINAKTTVNGTFLDIKSIVDQKKKALLLKKSGTQKEQDASAAYQKKILALLSALSPSQSLLLDAQKARSNFITNYVQTGTLDQKNINDVTQKYIAAITSLVNAYRKVDIPIDFTVKSNAVTSAVLQLMNFFLQTISLSVAQAESFLKKKPADVAGYYQSLYRLSQWLEDTSTGFDAIIAQVAGYFPKNQTSSILSFYHAHDSRVTIDAFLNGLKNLSINTRKPTQTEINYATAYYNAILADITYIGDDKKITKIGSDANYSMAMLYFNFAMTLFEGMATSKNKDQLRSDALKAFQAADNYAKLYNKISTSQTNLDFSQFAINLGQAIKQLAAAQTAQQSGNVAQALDLYEQASKNFASVTDAADASETSSLYNQLKALQFINEGKKNLNDFLKANRTQLIEYIGLISEVQAPAIPLAIYDAMLQSLQDASQKAADAYEQAIPFYQNAQIGTGTLDAAISVLRNFVTGNQLRKNGDIAAHTPSWDNLSRANGIYQQMLNAFTSADDQFSKTTVDLVPFYPTVLDLQKTVYLLPNQHWGFAIIGIRHIAKTYIDVAATIDNQLLSYQYLSQAFSYGDFLSVDIRQYLFTQMQKLQITKDQVDKMLADAAARETAAIALPASAWQPDLNTTVYSSEATRLWQEIINAYRSGAQLKYGDSFAQYVRALSEYATAYKANVPTEFFPSIGAGIIRYEMMLAYNAANDAPNSATSLVAVQADIQEFFSQAQQLIKAIADEAQILNAADNLKKLMQWKDVANQAIANQQRLITTMLPKNIAPTLVMQVETSQGNLVYSVLLSDGSKILSITIADFDTQFAQVLERIGDAYFEKKDYVKAIQNYNESKKYYTRIQQPTKVDDKIAISLSYNYLESFLKLVIPNENNSHGIGTISVAGIQVPEQFETYYFELRVPDVIATYLPLDLPTWIANSDQYKKQLQDLLTNLLFPVFAYNILAPTAYSTYFSGIQPPSKETLAQLDSSTKLALETSILEAQRFKTLISSRFNTQRSSLVLTQKKDKQEKEYYALGIYYLPIPVQPSYFWQTAAPFNTYPAIFTYQGGPIGYYDYIAALSGPSIPEPLRQRLRGFKAVNDQRIFNQIMQASPVAYLTASALFKKRADYLISGKFDPTADPTNATAAIYSLDPLMSIKEGIVLTTEKKNIEELKTVNKTDFSIQLSKYLNAFDLLKSYVISKTGGIVSQYINFAAYLYKQQNDTQKNNLLEQYTASLEEWMGDTGQLFLVGDPQSSDYFWTQGPDSSGGVLEDVRQFYNAAAGLYTDEIKKSSTIQKAGTAFKNAADLVATKVLEPDELVKAKVSEPKKNYFGAITLYSIAFRAFDQASRIELKIKNGGALAWINAVVNGCVQNLVAQANARKNPVSVVDVSSGQTEQMSYRQLVADSLSVNPVASNLKSDFLDVLYFLTYLSVGALPLISPNLDKLPDATKSAARDNVTKYMSEKNISFDTVDAGVAWLLRADFKETLLGAFNEFGNNILATTDAQVIATNYFAMQQWTSQLYNIFSAIYANDFLPAVPIEKRALQILTDIKNEQQSVYAPAEQWLGKY